MKIFTAANDDVESIELKKGHANVEKLDNDIKNE